MRDEFDYKAILEAYPAIMTLFPIREMKEKEKYASYDLLVDTIIRLADISSKANIATKRLSDINEAYTISGLSFSDFKKLNAYLKIGQYDLNTETYAFQKRDIPNDILNNVSLEIVRQLNEDRPALVPYFSMVNAILALTYGLSELSELIGKIQNPELGALVDTLLNYIKILQNGGIEDAFIRNGDKIFAKADQVLAILNTYPSHDNAKKEVLLKAYDQIKDLSLLKIQLLAQATHVNQRETTLDQYSNLFMASNQVPTSDASVKHTHSM